MNSQATHKIYRIVRIQSIFRRNAYRLGSTYKGDTQRGIEKLKKSVHEETNEENQLVTAIFNKVMKEQKLNKEKKEYERKTKQQGTTQKETNLLSDIPIKELNTFKKEKSLTINENSKIQKKKFQEEMMMSTEDKNISGLVENRKRNKLTIQEKMKQDHFYKIFFSSKKVKIIKSQNHPIFIHLYKLATDPNYRHQQEKILLTNKKIILEREKNHITRIYTNSINNLRDFHSFDNFVLLSNRLLKKISFLYSFKNGVVAEVSHTFHYDHVGFPHLAFCLYNINYEQKKKYVCTSQALSTNEPWKIHINNANKIKQELEKNAIVNTDATTSNNINDSNNTEYEQQNEKEKEKEKETEILCNGDIGTLIRSCFLFKWQCIFNIISEYKNIKKKPYKSLNVNNIHNIDVFHPFSIRASAGYVLDIPYKNIELENIQEYTKKNNILLLKYHPQSSLFLNYNDSCSEENCELTNLLNNAKGAFLILDNYNHLEKKFTVIEKKYVELSYNKNNDNVYDRIYYINLKNLKNKNIGLIAAYSICMYILKVYYFKNIPQSPYVFVS